MFIEKCPGLLVACMLGIGIPLANTAMAASTPLFDQYGGIEQLPSPNGATGHWRLEQMNQHWTLIDPDGNAFFMLGVYEVEAPDDNNAMGVSYRTTALTKYGDNGAPNWGPAQVQRLRSWNFNTIGPYSSIYVLPVRMENSWPGDQYNPQKMPFVNYILRPSYYGMLNSPSYIQEPVKSFVYGINTQYDSEYIPPGGEADYFDSKLYAYLDALLNYDPQMAPLNDPSNPYRNWLIGVMTEESDQTYSFGSGIDFSSQPQPGHNHAHGGYRAAICSPIQTANPSKSAIYSDTTVYTKQAWQQYLESLPKYQTSESPDINKLNAAWGANYTTWGSSGTAVSGIALGAGDGSTATFTASLPNAQLSAYSVQIFVGGTAVGGDSGNGSVWGPHLSGTVNYSAGTLSITFAPGYAPANGAPVTANYVALGWGIGTGLLDEDGRHTSWMGTDSTYLTGANANFVTDIDGFLYQMAKYYFQTGKTHTLSHFNGLVANWNPIYFGPDALFGNDTPSRAPVLRAAGEVLDAFGGGGNPLPQVVLDFIYQNAGNKPLINLEFYTANPDSAMWRYTNNATYVSFGEQTDRAGYYWFTLLGTGDPPGLVSATYTASQTNPYIGSLWWKYLDTPGEQANWGLVTLSDNAYDGYEAVYTGSNYDRTIPCFWPLGSYLCGGEERTYGSFIGVARNANQWALQGFCESLGGCN